MVMSYVVASSVRGFVQSPRSALRVCTRAAILSNAVIVGFHFSVATIGDNDELLMTEHVEVRKRETDADTDSDSEGDRHRRARARAHTHTHRHKHRHRHRQKDTHTYTHKEMREKREERE